MNRFIAIFLIVSFSTTFRLPLTQAAEIQAGVSSNEAFVGFPITLQVRIDNASKQERPQIDDVDGLEIASAGAPSQSQRVMNINGRVTSTVSSVYQWQVTPTREGTFTIPPIKVRADGMTSITKAIRITASKSDPGDLMMVEVESNQQSVYVGEPIELTLKIDVKAYIDKEENIRLSDGSMWGLLSDRTRWGVFGETIEQLTMNRMQPRGTEIIRKDADGKDAAYYRYQVDATLYPGRPGPVDLDEVKIGFEYPLEISRPNARGRNQSPFDSMLDDDFPFPGSMFGSSFFGGSASTRRITKSMPLMIEPALDSVTAKQIPTAGRPKEFAGAVGRYVIEVAASDTNVQAGDPIELTIRVRGTGQMETIAAPPLSLIDSLTDQFKVTDQLLAGQVNRDQKIFTTTIRPKDETVTEIPAIPFSYFDPDSEEYETSYSEPIAITVTPAEVMKLDRVAATDKPTADTNIPDSKAVAGEPVSRLDLAWQDMVENKDRTKVSLISMIVPVFVLPLVVFMISFLMRGYVAVSRRSASEAKTLHAIKSADQASGMATAMSYYLARRWKVELPGSTGVEPSIDHILGHLRSVGLHRYAIRVEQWMDQANRMHAVSDAELEPLRQSAIDIVKDAKSQRKIPSVGSTKRTAAAIVALVILVNMAGDVGTALAEDNGVAESQTLINRAQSAYQDGDFATASSLLGSLDAESLPDPHLFVNLGNAFWKSGDVPRSKANYLRALNIDPTDDIARKNLLAVNGSNWFFEKATSLPMRYVLVLASLGWVILWATLALRLWTGSFPWRSITALCLLTVIVAGGIGFLQLTAVWFPHHAVIVAAEVQLRRGDGESFDVVQTIADPSGQVVRWDAKRPGWIHVTTGDGSQGWLPEDSIELVSG